MSYWPDDINSGEVITPDEILLEIGGELQERTKRLDAIVRESKLSDRTVLAFEGNRSHPSQQ